jgi:hypothetical protein
MFPNIYQIKMNMRHWSSCGNEIIEEMSVSMNEKADKYWLDVQILMGIATLLDPRFKIEMLLVCFEMLMCINGDECENHVREITKLSCDLMNQYQLQDDEGNKEPSTSLPSVEDPLVMHISNARIAKKSFGTKADPDLDSS